MTSSSRAGSGPRAAPPSSTTSSAPAGTWSPSTPKGLALPDDLLSWFAAIGGQLVIIGGDDLVDVDGTYARWCADNAARAALQRPDLHLFGTATDPDDAVALLADLHAALADPPDPASPTPGDPS